MVFDVLRMSIIWEKYRWVFLKHFQVSSFIVEWVNIIAHGEEIDAAIKQALEIDQKCYAGFDNVHTKKKHRKTSVG